jgi:uncharacterized protein with HEPN domain
MLEMPLWEKPFVSRSERSYLQDIDESCQKILRYTQGIEFEDFLADDRTYDAVLLNLQVIGESAKNLSSDTRDCCPEIDWRKIAGLRDIIVHTYFQLEPEIIWDIVQTKLAPLQTSVQHLISSNFDNP